MTDPKLKAFEDALDAVLLGYSEAVADGANNTTDEANYQARALLDVVTSSEMVQGGLPYGTTAALRRIAGGGG